MDLDKNFDLSTLQNNEYNLPESVMYIYNVLKSKIDELNSQSYPAPTYHTVTENEATNKAIPLDTSATIGSRVIVDILDGGGAQEYGVDFYIENDQIKWDEKALDGVLTTGDKLRIWNLNS